MIQSPAGYDSMYRIKRYQDYYQASYGVMMTSTVPFSPAFLFAAGEQGVWYDPSDFATMFQDSAGITPVTAVDQSVGLMLDKSKGLVLGSELSPNVGPYANTNDWTAQNFASLAAVSGEIQVTAGAGFSLAYIVIPVTAGKWYETTATARRGTATAAYFGILNGNSGAPIVDGFGVASLAIAATNTTKKIKFLVPAGCTTVRVLVVHNNQSVGATLFASSVSTRELSGNHASQSVSTSRPLLKQDASGFYHLLFDGSDDCLFTGSIDFSATDKMSVFAGVRKLIPNVSIIAEISADTFSNNGSFVIISGQSSAANYAFYAKGTAFAGRQADTFTAPITNTMSIMYDIAQPTDATEIIPKINGVTPTLTTLAGNMGTGNFGNYPLYIGRRNNASLSFNGRLYSLIVRGAQSTAAQIANTETWVNGKTGAY